MNLQDKRLFAHGRREDQKEILNKELEGYVKTLKSAQDINTLRVAQGAVQVLEALLSSFD